MKNCWEIDLQRRVKQILIDPQKDWHGYDYGLNPEDIKIIHKWLNSFEDKPNYYYIEKWSLRDDEPLIVLRRMIFYLNSGIDDSSIKEITCGYRLNTLGSNHTENILKTSPNLPWSYFYWPLQERRPDIKLVNVDGLVASKFGKILKNMEIIPEASAEDLEDIRYFPLYDTI